MRDQMASLDRWRASITGALKLAAFLVTVLFGALFWMLTSLIQRFETARDDVALVKNNFNNFIKEGPRFTHDHYNTLIRADLAEFRENNNDQTEKILDLYAQRLDSYDTRIDVLERNDWHRMNTNDIQDRRLQAIETTLQEKLE